jgi:hypothetical protein
VFIFESDRLVIHIDDAAIGDGNSKNVAGEIIEDTLLASRPRKAISDPLLLPDGFRYSDLILTLQQNRTQSSAYQARKCFDWDEESGFGGNPLKAIATDSASGDEKMDMDMIVHLGSPRVENGEYSRCGAEMFWISAKCKQRISGHLHESAV